MVDLFRLHNTFLYTVLIEWSQLKDMIHFDTAITDRILLQNLYQSDYFSLTEFNFPKKTSIYLNGEEYDWIALRGIKIKHLTIDGKVLHNVSTIVKHLNKSKVSHLTTIHFTKDRTNSGDCDWLPVLNGCTYLESLKVDQVHNFTSEVFCKVKPRVLRSLKYLKLQGNGNISNADAMSFIAANCRKLEMIHLALYSKDETPAVKLIQNNLSLIDVTLNGCKQLDCVFEAMAAHTPYITTFKGDSQVLKLSTIIGTLQSCKQLTSITLPGRFTLEYKEIKVNKIVTTQKHVMIRAGVTINPDTEDELTQFLTVIKNIDYLDLVFMNVTDKNLNALAQHSSNLQSIKFEDVPTLCNKGVGELLKKCGKLHTFYFYRLPAFTIEHFVTLFTPIPDYTISVKLKSLLFKGIRLSNPACEQMINNTPTLTEFVLDDCCGVREQELERLYRNSNIEFGTRSWRALKKAEIRYKKLREKREIEAAELLEEEEEEEEEED